MSDADIPEYAAAHMAYAAQRADVDPQLVEHILNCEEPFCREFKKTLMLLSEVLEQWDP